MFCYTETEGRRRITVIMHSERSALKEKDIEEQGFTLHLRIFLLFVSSRKMRRNAWFFFLEFGSAILLSLLLFFYCTCC